MRVWLEGDDLAQGLVLAPIADLASRYGSQGMKPRRVTSISSTKRPRTAFSGPSGSSVIMPEPCTKDKRKSNFGDRSLQGRISMMIEAGLLSFHGKSNDASDVFVATNLMNCAQRKASHLSLSM
jgi:hypothetical protein